MWLQSVIKCLGVCLIMAMPNLGFATTDQSRLCDSAAAMAAEQSGVPLSVLMSIARAESGYRAGDETHPWPWTMNVSGKGFFFASQAEAERFAQAHLDEGNANFDVGCFQINLRWHSRNFQSLQDAFDPYKNAAYAAEFLGKLYNETGDWSAAVAAYHSRTEIHAKAYLQRVKSIWYGLQSQLTAAVAAPKTEASSRQNTYALLRGAPSGLNGSLMPASDASISRFSAR